MINIMIGYDDHTSTYAIEQDEAERILKMDNINAINSYIVDVGYYVNDAYEAQCTNTFLDVTEKDVELQSLFFADLKEELSISP